MLYSDLDGIFFLRRNGIGAFYEMEGEDIGASAP
jgi:hypothetical protein